MINLWGQEGELPMNLLYTLNKTKRGKEMLFRQWRLLHWNYSTYIPLESLLSNALIPNPYCLEVSPCRFNVLVLPCVMPSSCATRSHMVTSVPLSEFPVSRISNHNWNPRPEWMWWVWEKLLLMEGAILNGFYPLVISETFTLVPFCFFVPVLQIYMYFVLFTWIVFLV